MPLTQQNWLDWSVWICHKNGLSSFGPELATSLCQMPALKSLNLSGNLLEKPVLQDCMNSMTVIDEDLRNMLDSLPNLRVMRLDRNPSRFDCNLIDTFRWYLQNFVRVAKFDLRCGSGYNSFYVSRPILSLSEPHLKCHGTTSPKTSVSSSGFKLWETYFDSWPGLWCHRLCVDHFPGNQ